MEVIARTIEKVYAADLVAGPLTLVWHAGEPLAVPVSYYEQAFAAVRGSMPAGATVRHCMQSNGILLNERWCEFIKTQGISIGLSIDGPAFIHDAHRKTRQGKGTHEAALRGLRLLQSHHISFHVISVITCDSLPHAEEIYRFFADLGVVQVGFNIEEVEGENAVSSLGASSAEAQRIRAFMETIFRLQKADGGRARVREFDAALEKLRSGMSLRDLDFPYFDEQVRPFGILNVDCEGNFSTYSPELLGMHLSKYGRFIFGNVPEDDFVSVVTPDEFRAVFEDIVAGIRKCRDSCAYYGYCGGGAPANKYYENGSLATTETVFCRHSIQLPLNLVLSDLEQGVTLAQTPAQTKY